jgi:hypothetical protein
MLAGDRVGAFALDITVHARSLVAAPLFILGEAACASRLGSIALHFGNADLLPEHDRPRFDAAIASTKAILASSKAEIGAIALAYVVVAALLYSMPPDQIPLWQKSATGSFSPAGWWHALISLPLVFALFLGWMWRLGLWTRFLWLMSRLDLRLVPVHPDHMAGLRFVGYSVPAYSIVGLALASVVAGRVADKLVRHDALSLAQKLAFAGMLVVIVALFTAPLLVFSGVLWREWRRGVFVYGAETSKFGKLFERKWFSPDRQMDEAALQAPDFSAAIDLYQIVSNIYAMRFVPVDLISIVLLVGAVLLPFVPVVLMAMPIDFILAQLKGLLL